MRSFAKTFTPLLYIVFVAATLFSTACSVHARVYDPYYRDYHGWAGEDGYYLQWERDNHRQHEDFNRRSDADKKAYWEYRHNSDHH